MEEFIVPISRQDLTKRNNSNQYFVSKLVNVQSIPQHISVCEQEFRERGHLFIYNMFDYIFSVIHYWNEVDHKIKEKTWDMLLKSCKRSTPAIIEMINSNLSRDNQTMYRNSVKMNIYLLCQIIELFIVEIHQSNQAIEKGKGKKKKAPTSKIDMLDEIEMALNTMSQLFQSQIHKFWDPPIVEEDFVNLVTNTCYKLLENQEFCKHSAIREGIIKIIIIMITRYNHNSSCSVKLVQLLHSCPHFPTHLAYICRAFVSTDTMSGVIRDILTEICNYSSYDLERDNQAASSFSNFLVEFSTEFPNIVIPILPQLKNKLDEDPYTMRNCVLTIFGEVIIQVYSKDIENAPKSDSLLEVIEDHVADVNGFVRGKALSILLSVVDRCEPPLSQLIKILKLLVGETGAIFDTSSVARKNAIRIITCIVDLNLSRGENHATIKQLRDSEKIAMAELEEELSKMEISGDIADIEKQIEFIQEHQTEDGNNRASASAPLQLQCVAKEILEKKLFNLKRVILTLEQLMDITFLIESAINDIQCMLSSKTVTDVMEAISFFVKVKLSNLVNVDVGIRKMLPHICSKDDSIKAAITNAYKLLYLDVQLGDDEIDHVNRNQLIVDSLSDLVVNPTHGELTCLEKLVMNFVESGDMDQKLIECFWTRIRSNDGQFTPEKKKFALIILSMVAKVDKPFISKYFNILLNEGIPRSGFATLDLQFMQYICTTIQNLAKAQKKDKLEEPFRLPKTHVLFERLCNMCVSTFSLKHKINWIPLVNQVINTIYLLAENPNIICMKLISSFAQEMFAQNMAIHEVSSGDTPTQTTRPFEGRTFMLTRFIAVAGQVSMKQFIHFDVDILAELKRRNAIKEEKDQVKKTIRLEKHRKRQTEGIDKNNENNLEEEMGLVGATADDAEAEFIRKLCENELATDKFKLITNLLVLVVTICSNVSRFKDKDLQTIASLSLGKMMLISSRVCMDNIDLLFNMAARSPSEIIRANLIVPLGDLIKRFPTKLEPYTPHLYGRLRDLSPIVRLNALNVLSHLILNDMIKVKGQISEMTTCIVDDNPRIVHLSKIFFQELANKDKALYNVMPDIISRLSNPQTGVDETNFRTIMEYLMPFIQKKNQSENLFEKICMRFQSANDERSWRDLSFCLSLMPFNDTMLRALQFNLNSFAGKLHIDEVYTALTDILNNAKKNAKGEMTAVIEEMSAAILNLREQGVEDEEANINAQRAAMKKKMKSKKRDSAGSKDRSSRSRLLSQGKKDDDNIEEKPKSRKTTRNPKKTAPITHDVSHDRTVEDDTHSIASSRPRRTQKPAAVVFSDDSTDDEDSRLKSSRKRNRIVAESGSEESD